MKRMIAFLLVLSFLLGGLSFVPQDVQATGDAEYYTVQIYVDPMDGIIISQDMIFPDTPLTRGVSSTGVSGLGLSNYLRAGDRDVEKRAYISFNTSIIPAGALITEMSLRLNFALPSGSLSDVNVYSGSFGATLEATDWGSGKDNGTFQGSAAPTTGQHVVEISSDAVTGGRVQFEIALSVKAAATNSLTAYAAEAPSSSEPLLTVTYRMGYSATYEYSDGTDGTYELFPSYERYNNTYDVAMVVFETWTGVNNVSLTKLPGWLHLSHLPIANSTVETAGYYNLTGVLPNLTYRVYFAAPVFKQTTVYLASYHADTGEGFPFETFRFLLNDGLTYNNTTAEQIGSSVFTVDYGKNYTVTVLDYFGNVISSTPFVSNSLTKHVAVAIDVNSFKVFNQKEDFTRCRIYYQGAGTPIEYYAAPWEPVERFLRDGNYTITVTWYDNQTAGDSVYFNITVNSSEFLMLEGLTISRVISDVAGVKAVQEVITYMLTPDVVFIGEDLPMVPNDAFDSGIELVHPWSVVHGFAAGVEFTNETLFYYTYYTSRKYYEVALTLENADGVDWTNVTWFIGFPENRTIDYSSVRVYDLNNAVYLQAGLHYDMTLTGLRMKWVYFNDTLSRSLRISMYDANASSGGGMAIATASEYAASTYDGEAYYKSSVSWTNSFTYAYQGQYQVQFTFDGADQIKASSVIVYDKNAQRVLGEGEYTFAGGVLTVGSVSAVIGEVYGFDIYFLLDTSKADSWSIYQTFGGVPIWGWLVLLTGVGILAIFVADGKRTGRGKKLKLNSTAVAFALVMASMLFILWYFHQAGVL